MGIFYVVTLTKPIDLGLDLMRPEVQTDRQTDRQNIFIILACLAFHTT